MAKSKFIKKAFATQTLTTEEILEIKKCMYGYTDPITNVFESGPVYFCRKYIRVQHPIKGDIPLILYDFQINLIESFLNNSKVCVLASRQVGKSTVAAAYLLWYAIFSSDKTILVCANKNANAMELIGRIQYAYEYLPMFIKPGIMDDGWNKFSLKFDNASRILSTATSSDSGRGLSISLLFLDEFAFVKTSVQETFWTSILPTLSTGGSCIISSTPNGSVDKFSSIWRSANLEKQSDGISFFPVHVKWDEPPGRDEQFKKNNIKLLGENKWKQEFECVTGETKLTLMDEDGNMFEKTMLELSNELSEEYPNK
jgi:hypothetical protein